MKIKTAADILMTAALPVLMCYSIVGETAHEVIGIAMFGLFILHHILNFGWIKTLFKGKYDLHRIVNTAVNVLVFMCIIGLMYSGIVISKHIYTFLNLGGAMTARMKLKNKAMIWALRIIFGVVGAIGIYEFISLKFTDYLFGKVQFVFIDTNASALLTALQYLSVMALFAYIGYMVQIFLKRKKSSQKVRR